MSPGRSTALLLTFVALGFWLRWAHLGVRPMHNDEGVNAIKFGQFWQGGNYKYDPREFHGPTLCYATLAISRLSSAPDFDQFTERRLRALTVVFGLGLILLLAMLGDATGRQGTVWAALFTAVSPAMVFYSGYYIHEMLLVCFTFLAFGAAWRYWRSRNLGWALLAGLGFGLMQATKETFVLSLSAAGLGLGLNQIWNRRLDASGPPEKAPRLKLGHVAAGLVVWVAVWALLFSSFFTNRDGLLDSFRTYAPWLHRAAGESPHLHPWTFYFRRLLWFHAPHGPLWSEGPILVLATIGAASGFVRKRLGHGNAGFVRFLAFYSFALAMSYSLLAYKTPWCALSFWQPMILLAGVGSAVLLRSIASRPSRIAVAGLILAGAAGLGWEAWRATGPVYAADPRNPYVYVQTTPEVLDLVSQVEALAGVSRDGHHLRINVITYEGDCWPLPWYLRRFKQVAWYDHLPEQPYAPIMIVSYEFHAGLDEAKTHLMRHYFSLRPGVGLEFYVELELWKQYLAKHPQNL